MLAIWKKSGNFWKSPGPRAAPAAPAVAPVVERQSWPNGQVGAGAVMGDPQVTMGFKAKSWSNDLDDLGTPISGNLHLGLEPPVRKVV